MMWLVLLDACLNHRRVFIEQRGRDFIWSAVVLWVTPWTVALSISYDDPDATHTVFVPLDQVECVRDFSPDAARTVLTDAYRDEPPTGVFT
jgi:hypothetical protein